MDRRQPLRRKEGPRTGNRVMSVRMALAKLCACTCGGAVIGGGAVHVADNPPARPSVVSHYASHARSRGSYVRYASAQGRLVRRVVRRTACAVPTQTVSRMIIPPLFAPPPPPPVAV